MAICRDGQRLFRGGVMNGSYILWWELGGNYFATRRELTSVYVGASFSVNGVQRMVGPLPWGAYLGSALSRRTVLVIGGYLMVLFAAYLARRRAEDEKVDGRYPTFADKEPEGPTPPVPRARPQPPARADLRDLTPPPRYFASSHGAGSSARNSSIRLPNWARTSALRVSMLRDRDRPPVGRLYPGRSGRPGSTPRRRQNQRVEGGVRDAGDPAHQGADRHRRRHPDSPRDLRHGDRSGRGLHPVGEGQSTAKPAAATRHFLCHPEKSVELVSTPI